MTGQTFAHFTDFPAASSHSGQQSHSCSFTWECLACRDSVRSLYAQGRAPSSTRGMCLDCLCTACGCCRVLASALILESFAFE